MSAGVAPPNDRAMWKRLIDHLGPDVEGDLLAWTFATREAMCGRVTVEDRTNRIEFLETLETFDAREHTHRAFAAGKAAGKPYSQILYILRDCYPASREKSRHNSRYRQERIGATYPQLARIAYLSGMTDEQRYQWYEVCKSIPLSQRQAGHIIGKLES